MESETLGPHKISPTGSWPRLFPRHSDETYEALKQDIKLHGQTEPIARHRGLILDGVHRLHACIDLGKKPRIVDLKDDVSPIAFVDSGLAKISTGGISPKGKGSCSPFVSPKAPGPGVPPRAKGDIIPP